MSFVCLSYHSLLQDPIKSIQFGNSNPVCHAFDAEASDGHDLLIGLHSGDSRFSQLYTVKIFSLVFFLPTNAHMHDVVVYLVSLRQQLQDPGRKLLAAQHYNKEGTTNNRHVSHVNTIGDMFREH